MRLRKKRILVAIAALCLAVSFTVAVCAYLSATSSTVNNEFTAAESTEPSVSAGEKYSVTVPAAGYAVYVRVAVVVTFVKNGEILAQNPDVLVELENGWFIHDGLYYYEQSVASENATTITFGKISCTQVPEGYAANVQVIAQTIQAVGMTDGDEGENVIPAVTDAWEIEVSDDGKLKNPAP